MALRNMAFGVQYVCFCTMKHGFLYLTEVSVCMELACCLNKHIDFKWSGCYVVLHFAPI